MTLKIVSNNGLEEVHSVRIDGTIEVISVETGSRISIEEMEEIFPDFQNIIDSAESTLDVLYGLQSTNADYIWAHVSGKL
ncbi:hypothetical protein N5J31_06335 [Acinetobacter johnsonii]|uniref:hypothetical protein n=1 Tax=Acinetobacter johnsonii TaxID=40214 RepID=UPI00244868FC|nr:hypothetical protein [Acinetobacter johnsonii]MDH2046528.1 hypothetical protein [Acinetobacter johnsonii]